MRSKYGANLCHLLRINSNAQPDETCADPWQFYLQRQCPDLDDARFRRLLDESAPFSNGSSALGTIFALYSGRFFRVWLYSDRAELASTSDIEFSSKLHDTDGHRVEVFDNTAFNRWETIFFLTPYVDVLL